MSAAITPVILDTMISHIAPHFLNGANGDLPAGRHAASRMLAAYEAKTEEELRLAAEIVSFSLHALEALSEAAAPDLSLNKIIRLRGSAVSLSREAHKSQRKLDQLRRVPAAAAAMTQVQPPRQTAADRAPVTPDTATGLIQIAELEHRLPQTAGAAPISRQQRRAAERIAKKLKRTQAWQARRHAPEPARLQESASQHSAR